METEAARAPVSWAGIRKLISNVEVHGAPISPQMGIVSLSPASWEG